MNMKLTLIGTMAVACTAFHLSAMPTEKETRRAEPRVRKMLASEKAALNSGKKTRSEVAAAAMKLADEADTDAAKLLLIKGAFVLYVQDGNIEKAAETLDTLETVIPDIPPQYVTNMIDTAFFEAPKKGNGARLNKRLDESKLNTFAKLFPGWQTSVEPTVKSSHRGQDNVAFVHPPSQETPAVVSRTLTLSKGNPCLFLKMASFDKGSDFHLSVLVNGEEIVPKRLICTPDNAPWQDITIPLFAWRGEEVKIEIVLTANNWWCEHPFFKRLEVAEGTGREKLDIAAIGSETGRHAFERLFPGWQASVEPARESSHRGQNDVVFVHPPSQEMPAIVSRTMTLSNGNPCLFLKMASFSKDYDFLLSVLVNGKVVLPKRLVRTPDSAPWEDIVVPLSAWRGERVRIEVVLAANNWYCEHPFFKRLEVAEGTGQEKFVPEAKETVDGYTWSYRVDNGEATLVSEKDGKYSCAVSPSPKGDITIPETLGGVKVTGIGEEAFRFCNDLTSVTVPEGVTHIDTHALAYCRGLQSVTLPSSLRYIGYAAFGKDAELKSVTIPNGVKSIAADAFNGCGLKSVIIPESVMHIGDRAFCGCGALESVAISAGVASIGNGVFGGCNALKLITVDSGNQAFTSIDGVLYTKDRSELVMWPNPPKSAVIPEGVTKIRGWAFAGGSGMTSVTIPESVTSIDEIAFLACHGLKSITIPSRVKSIGVHAFEGCRELTEMTMFGERPEAKDLFPDCGKLKAIHVPANAKSWAGMKTWQGIPLVFDGEVRAASEKALNSGNATSKDVPNVEYKFSYKLEDGFAILTGVEPKPVGTLVVPDEIDGYRVTKIEGYNNRSPFWECDKMTKVVLPAGLEIDSFDPGAFISCKSLSSIEISDSNYQFASLDGALYSKDFSTLCVYPKTRDSIELAPGTKKIKRCAFRGCALKTAKVPEGVEVMEHWNLCECPNLESIELPKSLKHLGVCAVHGSDNVKKMVFNGDAPQAGLAHFSWGQQCVFTGAPADLVVEVRKGTTGWMSPDSTELPERWPMDQRESRQIRYVE